MHEHELRAVVITGASSGNGRATALLLARRHVRVFAGIRRAEDGEALKAAGGDAIVPIEIDVTLPDTIAAAARFVQARTGEGGIDGLVNNAGIGLVAPVEYMAADVLRRQFDVNVFGQIAVTQAFLPLIRRARGRIVNIGSVGSHFAFPFGGLLCGSKGAFSLMNDAMRLELRPFGLHVCLIEPAAIATPAVDKTLGDPDAIVAALPPEGQARYGTAIREFVARAYAQEIHGSPAEVVAAAVQHALTAPRPRTRYAVGAGARLLTTLPRILPDRAFDQLRLRALGQPTAFGSEPADRPAGSRDLRARPRAAATGSR